MTNFRLWLESFGTLELVGVEGTGSYGAGLTRLWVPTCHPMPVTQDFF